MSVNAEYDYLYFTSGTVTTKNYYQGEHNAFTTVDMLVSPAMQELCNAGVQPGDVITLHVEGLRSATTGALYNGDGKYSVNYIMGDPVIDLVQGDVKNNTEFFSYYPAGDQRAKLSFTFNKPFDTTRSMQLEETVQGSDVPRTVYVNGPALIISCLAGEIGGRTDVYSGTFSNGNQTVTYDLSGVDFGDFYGGYPESPNPTITLRNIYGAEDGNMALGPDPDAPGAFQYMLNYKQYAQASFDVAWVPEEFSSLANESQLKMQITTTISDGTGVLDRLYKYDGIEFSDANGNVIASVPESQCTKQVSGNKTTITCTLPAAAKTTKDVVAKLKNPSFVDGLIYLLDNFQGTFNAEKVAVTLRVEPASGSTVTTFDGLNVYTNGSFNYNNQDNPKITVGQKNYEFASYVPSIYEGDVAVGFRLNMAGSLSLDGADGSTKVAKGTVITVTLPEGLAIKDSGKSEATTLTYTIDEEAQEPEPVAFDVTLVKPALTDGKAFSTTDSEIAISVVGEPVPAYLRYDLYDGAAGTNIIGGAKLDNNYKAVASNVEYYQGHTYNMVVTGYNSEADYEAGKTPTYDKTITFEGASTPFHYSEATVTTVSPESGTRLEVSQNTITVTFSEPVFLNNAKINLGKADDGQGQKPREIQPSPDDARTQYTFTIDTNTMQTQRYLGVYFQAKDDNGGTLRGYGDGRNMDQYSYYLYEYTINNGADLIDLTVTPAFGTVESIDRITLNGGDYELPKAEDEAAGKAYLENGANKIYLTYSTDAADQTVAYLTPASAVTEAGTYTLVVPERYIECSPKGSVGQYFNREVTGTYIINAATTGFDVNLVKPALTDGKALETTDYEIAVEVSGEPVPGYLRYDLYDNVISSAGWMYGSQFNEEYTAYAMNTNYIDGHTYFVVIKGYDSQDDYDAGKADTYEKIITFGGLTPAVKYSKATVKSVTPTPDTRIEVSQKTFTVTFSEAVKVYNAKFYLNKVDDGQGQEPIAVTPAANATRTQYTFTVVDDKVMQTQRYLGLSFQAKDDNDDVLEGNGNYDHNNAQDSNFLYGYTINNGADLIDLTVTPAFGTVDRIERITINGGDYDLPNAADANVAYLQKGTAKIYLTYTSDATYYNIGYLEPETAITEAGEYTLVVPERYLFCSPKGSSGEYYNREVRGTYTIAGAPVSDSKIVLTPALGSTVESLSKIEIKAAEGYSIAPNYGSYSVTMTGPNGTEYTVSFEQDISTSPWKNYLVIRNSNGECTLTGGGVYTLTIATGSFYINGKGSELNEEITGTYTIPGNPDPDEPQDPNAFKPIVTPALGTTVEELSEITFAYPYIGKGQLNAYATITSSTGNIIRSIQADSNALVFETGSNATCTWKLDTPITESGDYYLTVDAKFFMDDHYYSQEITGKYTVKNPESGNTGDGVEIRTNYPHQYTENPEVASIQFICISFDGVENSEVNITELGNTACITFIDHQDNDRHYTWYAKKGIGPTAGVNPVFKELGEAYGWFGTTDEMTTESGYILTFDKDKVFTDPGTYTLHVPARFFVINSPVQSQGYSTLSEGPKYTGELRTIYTIAANGKTGIQSVTVETASQYVVYNINGQCVMRTAVAEDLVKLPAGLYIINGKKTLIRQH